MVSQHVPALAGASPGGLLAGQVVGSRYTCLGPLRQDVLGPIYRAQRDGGVPCTLQVLAQRPDPRSRKDLERDLRSAAALRHPNLGSPVELFVDEGGAGYLVREAMAGETLEGRLQRLGRPPVDAAFDILERVAAALRAAHRRGLWHLHLSPDKVFLQQSPRGAIVRVLDLGLWRLVRPEQHAGGLQRPRYVAPEQVVSPRSADGRTDVYGLGLLLFELLSGRPPFSTMDSKVLLAQHVNDNAPMLADRAPDRLFSAELESLLASMLAKAPQDRPKDAGALLDRLHRLRREGDLVIALDDRESALLGEWQIAGAADSEVQTGVAPDQSTDPEIEDVPGLPELYRSQPPRRPTPVRQPSGLQRAVQEVDRRPGPAAVSTGLNSLLLDTPTVPELGGGEAPAVASRSGLRSDVPLPVRDGDHDTDTVADALEPLLLPASADAGEADRAGARAWLGAKVALFGLKVPRGALVLSLAGGVLGAGLLLLTTTLEGPPPVPVKPPSPVASGPQLPASQGRDGLGAPGPRAAGPRARPVGPVSAPAAAPAARPPAALAKVDPLPPAKVDPLPPAKVETPKAAPGHLGPGRPGAVPPAPPGPTASAGAEVGPGVAPPGRISVSEALGKPLPLPDRAAAQQKKARRERSEEKAERPRPAAPSAVTIRILTSPTGAQVLRDGQVLGTTPFSEALRRGSQQRVYRVHRSGYEPARLEVVPSQDRLLQLELNPIMVLK